MTYAIVDLDTDIVTSVRSLGKVRFPDGGIVFNPEVGYEHSTYKIYEVVVLDSGSGPRVVSTTDPVYDASLDRVTVTRTLSAVLPRVIPDALKDIPASTSTVAGLRTAMNRTLAYLRGD